MEFFTILMIGIGLSMDAFSLSICYGTLNLKNRSINVLSVIVGLFHFIMPQSGIFVGNILSFYLSINVKYIIFFIFTFLGMDMINNFIRKKRRIIVLNNVGFVLFGFAVSIDSFSAGIGVKFLTDKYIFSSIIFAVISALFTFFGLKIGRKLTKFLKDLAPIIGGVILILIAMIYLFK